MDLQIVYLEPAKVILAQIGRVFVKAAIVLIILLIGWIIAKLIKSAIVKILRTIKVDDLSERINLSNLLMKGGITNPLSELIGIILYWVVILTTFLVGLNAVGLTQSAQLLERAILYIPHIVAAIFILILGMFLATVLGNIIKTAALNAGIEQAPLLNKITQGIVIAFAIAISLEQLKIATLTIHSTISIIIAVVLGSMGLGLALAFGLGCKDIVSRYVSDFLDKVKSKK
jgi:hypothetical protein